MAMIRITNAAAIQKRLEALDGKDRQNTLRRAVRAAAKPFQKALVVVATSADVPRSFRKVPAAKVSASRRRGFDVAAIVRPSSPLFNIFEPGAGGHQISGDFMFGPAGTGSWDAAGRKRPDTFAARGSVRHPGMKARPILPTAFARGHAEASKAFADAVFKP